jgi:hypothetical protein
MNWQKLYNPFVIALLRSPLHGLFDTHTMLITLTGRTSGKRYTFPVSSVYDGETLFVISRRDRTWWKNLRSGAQVTVLLRGHAWQARGASFTDTETVANDLLRIMQRIPAYQRLFHIKLDVTGQPEHPQELTRLAEERVIVRMRELTELSA